MTVRLQDLIKQTVITENQIAVCSLGQAGYIFKLSPNHHMIIDPYFSNVCEEKLGFAFKRLMPSLIVPEEVMGLGLDAYFITHHHEDHLDPVGIEAIKDSQFPFYAPPEAIAILHEIGIDDRRCSPLFPGAKYQIGDAIIHGVFADHGELAPDAVGIVIEAAGKIIYHMGDTCLNEAELLKLKEQFAIDLLILPINGMYGNMNVTEAVKAVSILQPEYATPCHFWMLPANSGGDLVAFIDLISSDCPLTDVLLFTQGEICIL